MKVAVRDHRHSQRHKCYLFLRTFLILRVLLLRSINALLVLQSNRHSPSRHSIRDKDTRSFYAKPEALSGSSQDLRRLALGAECYFALATLDCNPAFSLTTVHFDFQAQQCLMQAAVSPVRAAPASGSCQLNTSKVAGA